VIRILFFLIVFSSFLPAQTITILHTNDMHCQYTPAPATWVQKEPKPMIGGMTALEYYVRTEREKNQPVLLLDAGDIMTGTPIAKISREGVLGGGFMDMMNLIGYNAMSIGNHEFDEGQENLKKLIDLAHFDVLSANLYKNEVLLTQKPYAVYTVGSVRVGVIGLTLKRLFDETAKKNLDGIIVSDPAIAAQKYIDEIDHQTDLIILLTHEGVDEDLDLADKIHGADLIVGGHSHSRVNKPIHRNHVLIVQADSKTRYLGRLSITVQADSISRYEYQLIPTWVDSVKNPSLPLKKMVQEYEEQIINEYGQPLGTLMVDWQRNNQQESNIGNYLADVIRSGAAVDFAVLNSGGIRKDLHKGALRKLDIVEILPFTNYITKFQCTGTELKTIIETNARATLKQEPGILQISGLSYSFRITRGGTVEILSAKINGKAIDPKMSYTGAAVDFIIYGQAEKYFGFTVQQNEATGLLLSDAVIEYIQKHPTVVSKVEGRIRCEDRRKKK
jgi:2',3'-cyclic-nucleotide 2'-phosphodiesterase (5'-nucleotidase family)